MKGLEIESLKEIKDDKELLDIVEKIMKLQCQIEQPDRSGMIDVLRDAQQIASDEIVQNMQQQGEAVYCKPRDELSDNELYHILWSYRQGVINHGIVKMGKASSKNC